MVSQKGRRVFLEVNYARLKGRSRNIPQFFATSYIHAYSMSFGGILSFELSNYR